jgi:hypothetical protein
MVSGEMISLGGVEIVMVLPSSVLISKLKPVSASSKVIFLEINKSAPFLL